MQGPMMIPRYTRTEAAAIWTDEAKYRIWFEVEAAALEAMAEEGLVPEEAARTVREKGAAASFDVARIQQIEAETKHDVIAFLTHLAELVGPEARFVHKGMTSSDVLDTALSMQLTRACDLLLSGLERVLAALKTRAHEHKDTLCIGRSHGIHAEPTTFGLKLAGHYAEFARCHRRLLVARDEIGVCAISGAVGTYAHLPPQVEARVAEKLGLQVETHSTQVIPRDRHAAFFAALALIASAIERLATEIRHLQRTEVREAEEAFGTGQKGSSAMPHKKNPILSENLTGLARLVRSSLTPAMENVALWHERDISHSSVERGIAPDATVHLDFALHRTAGLIEGLVVHPQRMRANLEATNGLIHSQSVLLALAEAGMSRDDAYVRVQAAALACWETGEAFRAILSRDAEVSAHLGEAGLATAFDETKHTRAVDTIFKRVFAED
jgi:adenylosuccinate lyase